MCQLSIAKLLNPELAKKFFLIAGTLGSNIHNDGWGFATEAGKVWKCDLPMNLTIDSGTILKKRFAGKTMMGHIRQASAAVPVEKKNSHPFELGDFVFAHNGTLTPLDLKEFVTHEDVVSIEKIGTTEKTVTKSVKRSDSLVFFECFTQIYENLQEQDPDQKFILAVQQAMEKFHGKFAFLFLQKSTKTYYIVRGRTADLHVSYLLENEEDDAKVKGFAINTSKDVLNSTTRLLANLHEMETDVRLFFSLPELLKQETIFKVSGNSIEVIGQVKENSAPLAPSSHSRFQSFGRGDDSAEWGKTTGHKSDVSNDDREQLRLISKVLAFSDEFSMSPQQIQFAILDIYGISWLNIDPVILKHFVNKAIPNLASATTKVLRRRIKNALSGQPLSAIWYVRGWKGMDKIKFPWMINPKHVQADLARVLETLKEEQKKALVTG